MNKSTAKKITVFLYHDVNNDPSRFCKDYNLNVSISVFKSQIKWIKRNFNIISPKNIENPGTLPNHSALITFDDGFLGAYSNGIRFLIKNRIPSIMFLNMGHIINRSPIISAKAIFYQKFSEELKISKDQMLHLIINPSKLKEIENTLVKNYNNEILRFQGSLADYNMVKEFAKNKYVYYGNHLFDHWNSPVLNNSEFIGNLKKNEEELKKLNNSTNFFAFPNGIYTEENIRVLKNLKFKKIFYSTGNNNFDLNSFMLDRIALTELEYNPIKLYLRVLKSNYKSFVLNKFLGILRRI